MENKKNIYFCGFIKKKQKNAGFFTNFLYILKL